MPYYVAQTPNFKNLAPHLTADANIGQQDRKLDTYAAPLQYFVVKRVLCSDIWMENNANALQGKSELCYDDDFILRSARI